MLRVFERHFTDFRVFALDLASREPCKKKLQNWRDLGVPPAASLIDLTRNGISELQVSEKRKSFFTESRLVTRHQLRAGSDPNWHKHSKKAPKMAPNRSDRHQLRAGSDPNCSKQCKSDRKSSKFRKVVDVLDSAKIPASSEKFDKNDENRELRIPACVRN